MAFESELVARQDGDIEWVLVEPLAYQGNKDLFVVPTGSRTDFASVPAVFQWLIPRSGRYTRAAVLHDHLWEIAPQVSRADADGIFRRAMAELGVPFLRRWIMWAAVRVVSLVKSRFRDGRRDITRVLALVLLPGSLVLAGALFALVLFVGFWLLEVVLFGALSPLRRIGPVRRGTKPTNRPTILWSS
jgi:hypothetical protein